MTSPTPRAFVGTPSGTTDATSFAITLPTHEAGDTLGICLVSDGTPGISCTGWTQIQSGATAGSTAKGFIFVKDEVAASSSETNPTFISDGAQQYAAIAFSIPGAAKLNVEASSGANGLSTSPDPPSFSPSGGSQDYLWLAFAATDNGSGITVTGVPSGYTEPATISGGVANGNGNGCTAGLAYKQSTASSDDPSAFTLALGEQWGAFTVAIWGTGTPAPTSRGATLALMGVG
ncbi:MAG: hypothetical protein AB7G25_04585 [Sphingomonadaceae bacterium]